MNSHDLEERLDEWGLDRWTLAVRLKFLDARHRRAFRTAVDQSGAQLRPLLHNIIAGKDRLLAGYREAGVAMGKHKSLAHEIITDVNSPMLTWTASDGMIITTQLTAHAHGKWWDATRLPEAHDRRIRRPATVVSSGSA